MLLRLPYRPEQFGLHMGPALTHASEVQFTWDELVRAAITVGRRNWTDVLRHGTYSVLEALWRLAIVRANLVEEPDGRLSRSDAFIALDPSEKGAVSYFLGLTFTKLIADKVFGVPWLLHLDVYRKDLNPHLAFTVKPDFVGMDAHQQWLVAESKGRTSGIDQKALTDAKKQTRSLRHLNGQLPALRIAVGTYFSSGMCRARVRDPEGYDEGAQDLNVPLDDFARAYYRPLVELIEQLSRNEPSDQRQARFVELGGLDARVALDEEILRWYRSDRPQWVEIVAKRRERSSILLDIVELQRIPETERFSVARRMADSKVFSWQRLREPEPKGLDGVEVVLGPSWSEEYMMRQPRDRDR